MSSISQAARKISRTDDTGVVWHVENDHLDLTSDQPSGSLSSTNKQVTPDTRRKQESSQTQSGREKGLVNACFSQIEELKNSTDSPNEMKSSVQMENESSNVDQK